MRLAHSLLVAASVVCVASFAEPTIDLHLIGDSTMADKANPEINPEFGWGQVLPRFFDQHVVVHNHAVNGRSTKSFIDEGKWAAVLKELKTGDYLFVEFGHNDEKVEDSTRYAAANTDYKRNLERFVNEARAKGATPVLFTPIVRRKFNARGALQETHGLYVDAARVAARETGASLIDLNALTAKLVGNAGPVESKQLYVYVDSGTNTMYPTGRQDDTHLSVRGATAVAKLVVEALVNTRSPLARYARIGAPAPVR